MFIAVPIAWLTLYKVLRETEEGRKPRGWSEERWESEKGDRRGEREREEERERREERRGHRVDLECANYGTMALMLTTRFSSLVTRPS